MTFKEINKYIPIISLNNSTKDRIKERLKFYKILQTEPTIIKTKADLVLINHEINKLQSHLEN